MARLAGLRIAGHPPLIKGKRAFFPSDESLPVREYISRNRDIVDASQEIIATPGEFEEQLRSGTWSTIRYARKTGKRVLVVLPDGRLL
jgi:predicted Rossmann fold nucleotide-binding protein DprA/Smf involved in DNA uptake